MIDISSLTILAQNKTILKDFSLQIGQGEIHALMGPNGSGKSTLASVIAGSPEYEVKAGKIQIKNYELETNNQNLSFQDFKKKINESIDLLKMKPDERARAGIFLSFQNPPVISGVEVGNFLRQIYLGSEGKKPLSLADFRIWVLDLMKRLHLKPEIFSSTLNETMSGGEKKKLEILQMILLKPRLIILDEIDSGLDVDALKIIAFEINRYKKENPESSFLIISHYNRIFSYVRPDRVHVMKGGRIVKSGGRELVELVEQEGYAKY